MENVKIKRDLHSESLIYIASLRNEVIRTPEHLNKNSGKLSGKWILNTSDLLLGSRNQQICQRLYTMLNTAKTL